LNTSCTFGRDTQQEVGLIMNDENDAQWKELCRQAAGERDPVKLNQLVREISRLIEARQNTNGHKTHQIGDLARTQQLVIKPCGYIGPPL
jgi:hypothetical protein